MQLSAAQQAASDFLQKMEPIERAIDRSNAPAFGHFVDELVGALISFGSTEREVRKAERSEILGIEPEARTAAERHGSSHNDRGVRGLDRARERLQEVKRALEPLPHIPELSDDIAEFQAGWREALLETDLSAGDVRKIDNATAELLEIASRGRGQPFVEYLDKQVDRLANVRRRADRGVVENIPIWKILALVVMLGAIVWLYFQCHWWGGCTATQAAIAFAIAAGASYFAFGC